MASIIKKVGKRFSDWFGYYKGPLNVYTGKEFAQGPGFDVNIEVFEIRRLGIKIVKDIKINVDSQWFTHLQDRLEANKEKQNEKK